MFGLGPLEIVILAIIGIILFGVPVVAVVLALGLSRKAVAVSQAPSEIAQLRAEVEQLREEVEQLKKDLGPASTNVTTLP